MNVLDQIILALYTICLTILSALIVLIAAGWREPLEVLNATLVDPGGRWAVGLVGALFFVSSVRMLGLAFRGRKPAEALVRENELGEVQVALTAVENLITRAGRGVEGVREIKTRVRGGNEGIRVHLRATVKDDTHLPGLADRLQETIQRHVRQVVGIDVEHVRTIIEDISDGRGRRGE